MNEDIFEEITNKVAVLLSTEANITSIAVDKLGSALTPQDNTVFLDGYQEDAPFFVITKAPEIHFRNKGREGGESAQFVMEIVFVGDFSTETVQETKTELKTGTQIDVNGIKTYTPSDTMRKIARVSGEIISTKIGCSFPLIMVEEFEVFSEGFYDTASGEVASYLKVKLYEKASAYNN